MNDSRESTDEDREDAATASATGAGAESPEEGNAAMKQAEDATVDDGDD